MPYLRVVGIQVQTEGPGRAAGNITFSGEEEEKFRQMAANPEIYNIITKSIAPSIFGSEDIKRSIACLLFGGSRKRLPDGLTRRGDINVLLLGDPGTAKSQLLKFVERVSPIAVYTSGKGSSAAGLTASVMRDPSSRGFVVEGGAMVLADGGVVCIDEFDKMREDDRVAIHEAMEQQTISIAKAGITTTLNSRCSVLAAANSVFGRWDDSRAEENIDFMPTILSRFDTIFIVKDEHDEKRDTTMARHVMSIHINASTETTSEGELPLNTLKRYVAFARSRCGPRLEAEAAEKLKDRYVQMRRGHRTAEEEGEKKLSIPITVRQVKIYNTPPTHLLFFPISYYLFFTDTLKHERYKTNVNLICQYIYYCTGLKSIFHKKIKSYQELFGKYFIITFFLFLTPGQNIKSMKVGHVR